MITDTFCKANELGHCSLKEIENWQVKQSSGSPGKLTAPGIEVTVTRRLIIVLSPLVLLIAQLLYMMQFRRREILRTELRERHCVRRLSLLDESWILDSLVLNVAKGKPIWRRVQSALMALFLFIGQSAPFLAVVAASYSFFRQIEFGHIFLEEFSAARNSAISSMNWAKWMMSYTRSSRIWWTIISRPIYVEWDSNMSVDSLCFYFQIIGYRS